MHRKIQRCLLCPFLLLLSLSFCITGSVASPSVENKTATLEINSTDPSSRNSSSLTTVISSAPQPTKITLGHRSTREYILFITGRADDYYDDYSEITSTVPPHVPLKPCPYDRCKHLEIPCKEMQSIAKGRCLCPGVSGPSIPPNMPHLTELIPGEKNINVSWCSPMSTVHGYKVLYGPTTGLLERGPVLNGSYRFYSIGELLPNTRYRVCILAFNDVGESLVEGENFELESDMSSSCRLIYTTSPKYIYIYVGVALAVLAGLVGLAVLGYWLHWKRKRSKEVMWEEMVLPNQLYKGESIEQL